MKRAWPGFVLFLASGLLALALGIAALALQQVSRTHEQAAEAGQTAQRALAWQSAEAAAVALARLSVRRTDPVGDEAKEGGERLSVRRLVLTPELELVVAVNVAPPGIDPRSVSRERLAKTLEGLELTPFDALGATDSLLGARQAASPPVSMSGWLAALRLNQTELALEPGQLARVLDSLELTFTIGVADPLAQFWLAEVELVRQGHASETRVFLIQIADGKPNTLLVQQSDDMRDDGLPAQTQQG